MAITPPIQPTPLPTPPSTNDPSNFDTRADQFLGALPAFQTQTNTQSTVTYNNALDAATNANKAAENAAYSLEVSKVVAGAANFKGLWSNLTESLSMPASVKHDNRFWLLVRNVANVAAETPGVSTAWTSMDTGQAVTQKISANTTGITGVKYLIVGANVTLTAPTGVNKGDRFGFMLCVDRTGNQRVDFGSVLVRGQPAAMLVLDVNGAAADLQYEDISLGWV